MATLSAQVEEEAQAPVADAPEPASNDNGGGPDEPQEPSSSPESGMKPSEARDRLFEMELEAGIPPGVGKACRLEFFGRERDLGATNDKWIQLIQPANWDIYLGMCSTVMERQKEQKTSGAEPDSGTAPSGGGADEDEGSAPELLL